MVVASEHHEPLQRLTTMIDAGLVTPFVDRAHPLEEAADAMRRLVAGQVRGKVVLVP